MRRYLLLIAALACSACDKSQVTNPLAKDNAQSVDEAESESPEINAGRLAPFLSEIGFQKPFDLTTNLISMGNPDTSDRSALFVKVGAVKVVPWTEREPYWYFATELPAEGGIVTLPFAKRRLVGRSDSQTWKEGSTDYFSETISYVVDIEDSFSSLGVSKLGPYELRVTIANHPRVGTWAMDSVTVPGGGSKGSAESEVSELIAWFGAQASSEFAGQINAARVAAFDQIEQQFADQGLFERDQNYPDVIIRRADGFALHVDRTPVQTSSLRVLMDRCRTLPVPGYRDWQIATESQLAKLGRGRSLLETPDKRFWGGYEALVVLPVVHEPSRGNEWPVPGEFPDSLNEPWIRGFKLGYSSAGGGHVAKIADGNVSSDEIFDKPLQFGNSILICAAELPDAGLPALPANDPASETIE